MWPASVGILHEGKISFLRGRGGIWFSDQNVDPCDHECVKGLEILTFTIKGKEKGKGNGLPSRFCVGIYRCTVLLCNTRITVTRKPAV